MSEGGLLIGSFRPGHGLLRRLLRHIVVFLRHFQTSLMTNCRVRAPASPQREPVWPPGAAAVAGSKGRKSTMTGRPGRGQVRAARGATRRLKLPLGDSAFRFSSRSGTGSRGGWQPNTRVQAATAARRSGASAHDTDFDFHGLIPPFRLEITADGDPSASA